MPRQPSPPCAASATSITGPYQLDARRCISYLTIELKGAIPLELRPLIGNRIYGCDDCQLVCPWNKFAQAAAVPDFREVRNALDRASLLELFAWSEAEFNQRMQGSAIRRIGYRKWLSNIAVALGNLLSAAPRGADRQEIAAIVGALQARVGDGNDLVSESASWAIGRLRPANDQPP